MNRILIILAASVIAGAAYAQQAPILQGNYSANVLDAYNGSATVVQDVISTRSITREVTGNGAPAPIFPWDQNYSGK